MPEVAPVLAVGDDVQADRLLLRHRALDQPVLDRAEVAGRQGAGAGLSARPVQLGRPQEAADVLGAERRPGRHPRPAVRSRITRPRTGRAAGGDSCR